MSKVLFMGESHVEAAMPSGYQDSSFFWIANLTAQQIQLLKSSGVNKLFVEFLPSEEIYIEKYYNIFSSNAFSGCSVALATPSSARTRARKGQSVVYNEDEHLVIEAIADKKNHRITFQEVLGILGSWDKSLAFFIKFSKNEVSYRFSFDQGPTVVSLLLFGKKLQELQEAGIEIHGLETVRSIASGRNHQARARCRDLNIEAARLINQKMQGDDVAVVLVGSAHLLNIQNITGKKDTDSMQHLVAQHGIEVSSTIIVKSAESITGHQEDIQRSYTPEGKEADFSGIEFVLYSNMLEQVLLFSSGQEINDFLINQGVDKDVLNVAANVRPQYQLENTTHVYSSEPTIRVGNSSFTSPSVRGSLFGTTYGGGKVRNLFEPLSLSPLRGTMSSLSFVPEEGAQAMVVGAGTAAGGAQHRFQQQQEEDFCYDSPEEDEINRSF